MTTEATIGGKVGQGALWSLLNTVVLRLGTLVAGIALARILSPADYGVFAVALVAMTLLQSFNELGVTLALVRWERDVREFAPTALTIAVGSSTTLYAVVFFAAPAFCELMGSPDAVGVLRLLCVAVVLDGIAVVPATILNREFLQRTRFLCDGLAFVVVTSVTITLALNGSGPMSFAIGQLMGNVVSVTCYLLLCPVKVRPGWDAGIARELVKFGLPLAAASLLVLSVTNVDKIVIGAQTDAVALGLYVMAFNQSSLPLQVFSEAARRVSLAGFSRLVHNKDALEQALARGTGLLMGASVPVCVLLACYAHPLLHVVYGGQWTPAAVALQVLAVLGLVRILLFIGYDLLVALDGNRVLVGLQALWLGTMLPALIFGTTVDGIRGAAIAQVAVAIVVVVPAFVWIIQRRGVRLRASLLAIRRPVIGGLLVVGTALVVRSLVENSLAQLLIGGLVAVAVYLPVVYPMRALLPGRAAVTT
ncbi:MAG: oligosaccharide flippase family protein [Actinomycetota bacterium]|nr:oligosaccharide flippase family protein [Actinomycetota bacterium]